MRVKLLFSAFLMVLVMAAVAFGVFHPAAATFEPALSAGVVFLATVAFATISFFFPPFVTGPEAAKPVKFATAVGLGGLAALFFFFIIKFFGARPAFFGVFDPRTFFPAAAAIAVGVFAALTLRPRRRFTPGKRFQSEEGFQPLTN